MKRARNRQLRVSRGLLIAVGLGLLAVAILGALLASKAVDQLAGPLDAGTAVLNERGRRLLADHQLGFQLGGVAAAFVLIAVGLVWLKNQIPPVRHQEGNRFENPDPANPGHNKVNGGALAHALEADLERSESVHRARAEFRTDGDLVRLRLDVDEMARVDEILNAVVGPAVDRITTVAELDQRPAVQTDLRLVETAGRRTR